MLIMATTSASSSSSPSHTARKVRKARNNHHNSNLSDNNTAAAATSTSTGVDTSGKVYQTIHELWNEELGATSVLDNHRQDDHDNNNYASTNTTSSASANAERWYNKGAQYWSSVDATLDGVLGGFAHISPIDIQESKAFLKSLNIAAYSKALDCGAGIGRVCKDLLCPIFTDAVDLVEQEGKYVETAKKYIESTKMRNYYTEGLQSFTPLHNEYTVIWIQWCIGHLTDDDLIAFLHRCRDGLHKESDGCIILKENGS
jgi:protein N-terminal methyltransferase